MAKENFVTFTEVDSNNRLTVITPKATGANVGRDEDVYLYKDFGADYFNSLYITFELYVAATSVPTTAAAIGGIGFANVIDDMSGFGATDISAVIAEETSGFKIFLLRGQGVSIDTYIGSADTLYYCLLERTADSDTATLKIYSDAARTGLLDTLTISGVGTTTKWRYCYGFVDWNGGYANVEFDGYVQNLELSAITDAPTVTTQAVSAVTGTTATGNGNVTDLGDAAVTQHGVCWNTAGTPTTADSKTEEGAKAATGAFTSSITGLTTGTLYYARAYAINSLGTSYGSEVSFIASGATVETLPVIDIVGTSATGRGNITDLGSSAVTAHGVCWVDEATYDGGSHPPTTSDDKTDEGVASATGIFETPITELTTQELYFARAYATNSSGTSYGEVVSFTSVAGEIKGNIANVETRLHYTDYKGKERWVEGTLV